VADDAAGECAGDHPRQGDEISRRLKQAGRVERLATLTRGCNMTSATITSARSMGSRYAEGYGLIVFASALLLWGLCAHGSREKLAA
jgi:hypothetical protein